MKKKNTGRRLNKMRLYNLDCPIIGITGGVASGKSTASQYFQDQGFLVISADSIIKTLYQREETLEWFKEKFPEFVEADQLNFKKLSQEAFQDAKLLEELENFFYPQMESEFRELLPEALPEFLFYEIPLLFEKKKQDLFDTIVLITCDHDIQIKRLRERSQVREQEAIRIVQAQLPWETKAKYSDYIIENNGTKEEFTNKLFTLKNQILEKYS